MQGSFVPGFKHPFVHVKSPEPSAAALGKTQMTFRWAMSRDSNVLTIRSNDQVVRDYESKGTFVLQSAPL